MGGKTLTPVVGLSLLGLLAGAATQYGAFFLSPDTSVRSLAETCQMPSRQKLATDVTRGSVPQLDNFLCIVMPFFQRSVSNRLNVGLYAVMIATVIPFLYRLSFQAVSPNRKTDLLGALPILVILSVGNAFGFGPWSCILAGLVWIPGTYVALKHSSAAVPPVPTPASNIYLCNLLFAFSTTVLAATIFGDPERPLWSHAALALQFASFSYMPVLYKNLTTPKVNAEDKARSVIRRYDAEGISYSFERTWSYYRKIAAVSAFTYWYGINRIIRGLVFEEGKFDAVSMFWVFDILGLWIAITLIVASEKLTVRSKSLTHPVTGASRSPLDIECDKAILKAPAGSPWLEKSTAGFITACLAGGPGFAASMWWCSGEEEAGWKARKAWREAVAVDGKKDK
ncbi:hypothetical protein BCV70DRAFT_199785 [Testicularia cyperi]|uniref:MFS general substrate transporter n=1 Tax=Testicularia cyperi TaxID=1882483 RepID=A0A317XQG5_9BASI|nr:hypothetical protein BCV70DRAFT_199785 [Testicularia cyperi]